MLTKKYKLAYKTKQKPKSFFIELYALFFMNFAKKKIIYILFFSYSVWFYKLICIIWLT